MRPLEPTLSIHFSPSEDGYNVRLAGPQVGEFRGEFAPPYNLATWEAILYALEPGFNLAETENAKQAALRPLGDIGRLHQTVGKSLETMERVGDLHGLAQTYNNLGLVYAGKGEWDRAIEYFQKDLEISERVGDIHGLAQTYNNLGLVYADKGEWDRAIEYYQKSLETKERVGDIHGMASTWGNIGFLYLNTGRSEEARPLLARAYFIFAKIGSPDQHSAAQALVQVCGSVEAANSYLAEVAGELET